MSSGDKSAFSRFTSYAKPSSSSGASLSSGTSQASSGPARALEALEALAFADADGRMRQATVDTGRRSSRDQSAGSRERQREQELRLYGGAGGLVDSPLGGPQGFAQNRITQATGSGYWGGESLPPNASTFSNFASGSAFDGSHFFTPGASGFSFEGDGSSYRPSGGAPSIFRGRSPAPEKSSIPGGSAASLGGSSWDYHSASNGSSPVPLGGGRKRRDASRALSFTLPGTVSGDRGVVGIAKPREGDHGRVAVAGKTFLKILKVPSGEPVATPFERVSRPTSTFKSSSSLAYRRAQSRGSPAAVDRSGGPDAYAERKTYREDISETMDVRVGSRLGPGFLFTDVGWGYGATSSKVATSFSNGAVVLWDLEKEGSSRVDQLKYEHDRAVNRVAFGGASGSWLLSAGQDGQMKFWDVREAKAASLVLKASSPVRHVAFSPSAAQPFTLLAVCSSGTLIRYDIRFTGRQGGGATDRIAGHVGACLAMDWRDNLDNHRVDSDRNEGGWVITGGLDKTIKIWDFSLPTLSTKPVRTLYSSQPVQAVAWHPTRATELASSPLPSLSLNTAAADDGPVPSPESPVKESVWSSWKNEIEIWDTREIHFPKLALKTEEPTSAILYNDKDTLWSASKASATFQQWDVASDSYSLLDSYSHPPASWNIGGELAFVDEARHPYTISRDLESALMAESQVDAPTFKPEAFLGSLIDFDPDFSADTFEYLANHLALAGKSFGEICDLNAEASDIADRSYASQLWSTLKIWLDDSPGLPLSPPPSPPPFPPLVDDSPLSIQLSPLLRDAQLLPPAAFSDSKAPHQVVHPRKSFSNPHSRARSSANSSASSPIILAVDSTKGALAYFSEESISSETDATPAMFTAQRSGTEVDSSASDSENELMARHRQIAAAHGGPPAHKLLTSLAAVKAGRMRSATVGGNLAKLDPTLEGDLQDFNLLPSSPALLRSRRPSSSSCDSDEEGQPIARVRTAKMLARQASLAAVVKPRRASWDDRPPSFGGSTAKPSRQPSVDYTALSRRQASAHGAKEAKDVDSTPLSKAPSLPSSAHLHRAEGVVHVEEVKEIVKTQVKAVLKEYADRGDHQLCATICCVLRDKDIGFEPMFVARVTKAYLDLLRRAKLYVAAAGVLKYCATESLRALSQNSVVFHTACGKCGKGLENSPYGYCGRCSTQVTGCCICHLIVRSLLLFCATCGHGAHPECLAQYSTSLSTRLSGSEGASVDVSYPSTPGLVTPAIRTWMWGEQEAEEQDAEALEAEMEDARELLGTCPSGTCGHSPCLLCLS